MTCPCRVFTYQGKTVRITFHPGRAQPYTVLKRSHHYYRVYGFCATLKAAVAWL